MPQSSNLDLLRTLAVLMVVACHLAAWMTPGIVAIGSFGHLAVGVFFLLSSYVLMQSLERHGPAYGPFLIRRAFRIYPLPIALLALVIAGFAIGGKIPNWRIIVSNMLLIQNVTSDMSIVEPFWSLPFEVQAYAFLPPLFLLARRAPRLIPVMLVSSVMVVLAMWSAGVDAHLIQYAPCFLTGVLAYVMPRRAALHPVFLVAIIATSAVVVPILVTGGIAETPLLWAVCLALGFAIPSCREVRSAMVTRSAQIVAKYAFAIYATHVLAIRAGFDLFPDLPLAAKCLFFIVMLVAWARVAYRWVEAPGITLGVRIADWLSQRVQRTNARNDPTLQGQPKVTS